MIDTTNIKNISIAEYLIGRGWKLTLQRGQSSKVSHLGACPICHEGKDCFQVFKNNGFYCRRCENGGDIINLIQCIDSVDFKDACAILDHTNPSPFTPLPQQRTANEELTFSQWQTVAKNYWLATMHTMQNETQSKATQWLMKKRLVPWRTIEQFGIGLALRWFKRGQFSAPSGIVIPWLDDYHIPHAINFYLDRHARSFIDLKRKMVRGSRPQNIFFGQHLNSKNRTTAIICEGEIDTMLVHHYRPNESILPLGTNGTDTIPPLDNLSHIKHWFVISDPDEAGEKMARNWSKVIPGIKRIPLPKRHDVGEFLGNGGNLRNLLTQHCIRQSSMFYVPSRRGSGAYH